MCANWAAHAERLSTLDSRSSKTSHSEKTIRCPEASTDLGSAEYVTQFVISSREKSISSESQVLGFICTEPSATTVACSLMQKLRSLTQIGKYTPASSYDAAELMHLQQLDRAAHPVSSSQK